MAKLHKNNTKIHLEAPITTAIGHLDQQRKNVQSTKLMEVWEATPTINNGTQTHAFLEAMAEFNETIGAIHTYLTSQSPTYIKGIQIYVRIVRLNFKRNVGFATTDIIDA